MIDCRFVRGGLGFGLACVLSGASFQELGAQEADISTLGWMAGCWQAGTEAQPLEEQWMEPRGGMMAMMSRTLRDGSVVAYEFGLVRSDPGGLVFRAHPSGQDPAEFRAKVVSMDSVVFVNPQHDFPRRIQYRNTGPDRMVAGVFGEIEAPEPAFELDFRRVACPGGKSPREAGDMQGQRHER